MNNVKAKISSVALALGVSILSCPCAQAVFINEDIKFSPESDCGPSGTAPCFLAGVEQPVMGDVSASIDTSNAPGTAFYSENGVVRRPGLEFAITAPFPNPDFAGTTGVTWTPFFPLTSVRMASTFIPDSRLATRT